MRDNTRKYGPRTLGVGLVAFALAMGLAVPSPASGERGGPAGIEYLGELEVPWDRVRLPHNGTVTPVATAVDAPARRLYVGFAQPGYGTSYLAEYDLGDGGIPRPVRASDGPVTEATNLSSFMTGLDRQRRRLLILYSTEARLASISLVDLETLSRSGQWDLDPVVPGFRPRGLTYDPDFDLVYLVGEFLTPADTLPDTPRSPGAAIVALDGGTGQRVWIRPLPECDRPVSVFNTGALVARSAVRPVLYTFCRAGTVAREVTTGQSGLLRVHLREGVSQAEALELPTEFFPISGQYADTSASRTGALGFDPVRERVVVQSISTTSPGGWIFDGPNSAWVGLVASPDSNNLFLGMNPNSARYYMAGGPFAGPRYINATDARATPAVQGSTFWFSEALIDQQLLTDPSGGRIFAPAMVLTGFDDQGRAVRRRGMVAFKDQTTSIVPLPPLDFDSLTQDLADDEAQIDFAGSASGYGARYSLVGGTQGLIPGKVTGSFSRSLTGLVTGTVQFALGDRGTVFAAVPRVDIREGGASATATAAAIDSSTRSDQQDLETQSVVPTSALTFPYEVQSCLDGTGEADTQEQTVGIGEARVQCDLKSKTATARSVFSEGAATGGVSVAGARFDTTTFHDPERGAVTVSTAVAEGVGLGSSDASRVVIDRVVTTVETAANGRPGTTSAVWTRTVEGVTSVDPDGTSRPIAGRCTTKVVAGEEATDTGDCNDLAERINEALPTTITVSFPTAEAIATPKGALASVAKSEEDFLQNQTVNNDSDRSVPGMQVVVYNDSTEKSRLLVQLAAIDASSTFVRFAGFQFPDQPDVPTPPADGPAGGATDGGPSAGGLEGQADPTGQDFGSGLPLQLPGEDNVDPQEPAVVTPPEVSPRDQPPAQALPVAGPSNLGRWGFAHRGWREALGAAGLWLLLVGPLAAAMSRRRLMVQMT